MAVDTNGTWVPPANSSTGIWNQALPVSVSFWGKMNVTSTSSNVGPFYFNTTSGYEFEFWNSRVQLQAFGSGDTYPYVFTAGTYPTVGEWNHWAGVMNTNSMKIFKNGSLLGAEGTQALSAFTWTGTPAFVVGRGEGGAKDQSIAELAIFGKVLTADELMFLASRVSRAPLQIGSLKSYWPMDELTIGAATTVTRFFDYGASNNYIPAANNGVGEELSLSYLGGVGSS